jgi:asparagine synthase (glutamine-hydrolysing)
MCGIAGLWAPGLRDGELRDTLAQMTASLVHRGPDDEGMWVDSEARIGLGHRRLSIVDRSPAGHQPMRSSSGRYCLVFNGEIYNFHELRQALETRGHEFRGRSDTEVLLAAIEEWGPHGAIAHLNGMFAFAVWDLHDRILYLIRDRIGEKPLYYGWAGRDFVFASELKALATIRGFARDLDRDSLSGYFEQGYIGAPRTIYRDCWKLRPGHFLAMTAADLGSRHQHPVCYWDLHRLAEEHSRPFAGSGGDAVDRLDALLTDAVRLRMIADVPLGAFLSGGVDSTAVVGMMQRIAGRPVRTFTVGFADAEHDEAPVAGEIARRLGTDHTEVYITADEALAVVPKLPELFDEPFADSSAIPTYLVSAIARRDVTVALSGDGGDELFSGYARYARCERLWRGLRLVPRAARAWCGRDLLSVESDRALYAYQTTLWHAGDGVMLGGGGGRDDTAAKDWPASLSLRRKMMLEDSLTYLPDDILTKLDRATMSVSLEARTPLLDHRLIEFAWSLPSTMLVRRGSTKWILREVLKRHAVGCDVSHGKRGFAIPRQRWLRGPLREWAESLLNPTRLRNEGYLAAAPIKRRWDEHVRGRADWASHIWAVLMFQSWSETWNRRAAA